MTSNPQIYKSVHKRDLKITYYSHQVQCLLLILVLFLYLGVQLTRSTFPDFSIVSGVLHSFVCVCVYFILVVHKTTISASISLVCLVQCSLTCLLSCVFS